MSGKLISVCGGADASSEHFALAERVGELLAESGAIIFCGGGNGVMEAVCKGASSKGGTTVGLLGGSEPDDCNPHLGVVVPTGMDEMRNVLVVRAGAAVIAIGGGYGTLSEIGFALKIGKPVIGLRTFEIFMDGVQVEGIRYVQTPEEAVRLALENA